MVTLYENYTFVGTEQTELHSVYQDGQTFTPSTAHKITKLTVKLWREGNPGTITVRVFATSGGVPTGGVLASGTLDGNAMTTDSNGAEYEFDLGAGFNLDASTMYAYTIDGGIDESNSIHVIIKTDGSYSGGTRISSSDNGSSWSTSSGDGYFKESGDPLAQTISVLETILLGEARAGNIDSIKQSAINISDSLSITKGFFTTVLSLLTINDEFSTRNIWSFLTKKASPSWDSPNKSTAPTWSNPSKNSSSWSYKNKS